MPQSTSTAVAVDDSLVMIIKRIAGGSQPDLATLFDETSQVIFALVVRMIGNRAAAEETLLEIYVQVWRQSAYYNSADETPLIWLSKLARQQALAALRANGLPHSQMAICMTGATTTPVSTMNPGKTQSFREALDLLPSEQYQALEMAFFGGLNCQQIAAELRLAPDLIQRRIGIAMNGMRQSLSQYL
ncbi:MAG TPA: sigma factor [Blastocatellia bacterium]|nr:sigma factor [Blastocatellia bacterium]